MSQPQPPKMADLDAQRAAMKKLGFLVGKWSGEARILRGALPDQVLLQTEEAYYKLDGLLLVIEGTGHEAPDMKPELQAFGVLSYDDENRTYRMRAFNMGRFLETEINLLSDGQGLTWGFDLGLVKSSAILRINEQGDWTEAHDVILGSRPKTHFMDIIVSKRKSIGAH
jgi:hypothetical protein